MTLSPSKLVIAHRGASAYLPEHTLAAYALALGQGADGIETDVVLSADGVPICLHDLWLETTTDVAEHYDGRSRSDGHYYAIEFTFEQIAQLRAFGRVSYAERTELPRMHVVTLEDLLRLRQYLHRTTGKRFTLLVELKAPQFHREQGQPLEEPVLQVLEHYACTTPECGVVLQSFDAHSLQRLRHELRTSLPIYQLTGHMLTREQIDEVASYADGISAQRWLIEDGEGNPVDEGHLVADCHERGLKIFVWTMGRDEGAVRRMFWRYGVDGVITDNPDVAVRARSVGSTPENTGKGTPP
jgi:glycerophosphoryl diester phosphodiesterase